jgi:hypothetical protein
MDFALNVAVWLGFCRVEDHVARFRLDMVAQDEEKARKVAAQNAKLSEEKTAEVSVASTT